MLTGKPHKGNEMSGTVVEKIVSRARQAAKKIVLPESHDGRVLQAARQIADGGYARPLLLGEASAVRAAADELGVDLAGIEILDPLRDPALDEYTRRLHERRKHKGMTPDRARELTANGVYFAGAMVGAGRCDGMVAGSACPTKDTIRSALWGVGLVAGNRTLASCSIMQTLVPEVGVDGAVLFADTGVIPEPTVEQLADIAVHAADACRALLDTEPRVAMLSFSTKGSAYSPAVQKVIDATKLARSLRPDLKIEGELQLDAAVVPEVARRKAEGGPVAGRANTLIFPDLSSGNIGYKLVERLGQATALGPLLLGLAKPVNDLSRGCSPEEIALVTAITAVQAVAVQAAARP
jgi:phosphate acetyltransferase